MANQPDASRRPLLLARPHHHCSAPHRPSLRLSQPANAVTGKFCWHRHEYCFVFDRTVSTHIPTWGCGCLTLTSPRNSDVLRATRVVLTPYEAMTRSLSASIFYSQFENSHFLDSKGCMTETQWRSDSSQTPNPVIASTGQTKGRSLGLHMWKQLTGVCRNNSNNA